MAGLFAKAKDKAKASAGTTKPKKNTTWAVGDPQGDAVGKSLQELTKINAEMKALEAKKKIHANVVGNYAEQAFIRDFSELGVLPDTPMRVVNSEGDAVTYVVQDRGGQYKLKDEQIEMLEQILGEDAVPDLLYTQTTIGFNRYVMAIPGVSEEIEGAIMKAVKSLIKKQVIDEDTADDLITVDEKTAFKPGTLDRAATLVGRDQTRLKQFIDAMGSSCCRYVK